MRFGLCRVDYSYYYSMPVNSKPRSIYVGEINMAQPSLDVNNNNDNDNDNNEREKKKKERKNRAL
jgi:hypothetical protein